MDTIDETKASDTPKTEDKALDVPRLVILWRRFLKWAAGSIRPFPEYPNPSVKIGLMWSDELATWGVRLSKARWTGWSHLPWMWSYVDWTQDIKKANRWAEHYGIEIPDTAIAVLENDAEVLKQLEEKYSKG